MPAVIETEVQSDSHYSAALELVKTTFSAVGNEPLFFTDVGDLWQLFLDSIVPERRQHYTCRACRMFIERYGSLVTIDEDGNTTSAIWPAVFGDLGDAFENLRRRVERANVTGLFVPPPGGSMLGWDQAGGWSHLHVKLSSSSFTIKRARMSTEQIAAEKREEYGMLSRALGEYRKEHVTMAHTLLSSGQLFRCEKHIELAAWLVRLYDAREHAAKSSLAGARSPRSPSSRVDNVTWRAVASAPPGWCHVRSGMIGTLLDDISSGLAFDEIKSKFDAKMHPLAYLRPQAPPSAGNIRQANKIIAELNTVGALERRFAQLAEIEAFWKPSPPAVSQVSGGVFDYLLSTGPKSKLMELPEQRMTFVKFRDAVLLDAVKIEFLVPGVKRAYGAIVTAVNPDAPPILQWDDEKQRNPASWYMYDGGSTPAHWNLRTGAFIEVKAFTLRPSQWFGKPRPQDGEAAIAILDGCRDTLHVTGGGFFVQSLRSEYFEIRSTLEAHVKSSRIAGRDEASACGLILSSGSLQWSNTVFRVTSKGNTVALYRLDRWD